MELFWKIRLVYGKKSKEKEIKDRIDLGVGDWV
jgi:hypothetical protein